MNNQRKYSSRHCHVSSLLPSQLQGLPRLTTHRVTSPTQDRPAPLGPLRGPLHLYAERAVGAPTLSSPTGAGGTLPGALLPRTLSPIQQTLMPSAPTPRNSLSLPHSLPLVGDKGKGPAGGKPYKKKGTTSSSDENITSDEGGGTGEPTRPRLPSLSPIGSSPPQFPTRRPLSNFQTLPSLASAASGAPRPKISLPSMPPRKLTVDPFSTSPTSIDASTSLEPTKASGPPMPPTFQRPTSQQKFVKPSALPAIASTVKGEAEAEASKPDNPA